MSCHLSLWLNARRFSRLPRTTRYLAADVGGTFTGLVLVDGRSASPRVFIDKVPSQAMSSGLGVRESIQGLSATAGIVPGEIDLFVHGFTVGTNPFPMRSGAKAAPMLQDAVD